MNYFYARNLAVKMLTCNVMSMVYVIFLLIKRSRGGKRRDNAIYLGWGSGTL